MNSVGGDILTFLIRTLFSLYIGAVVIRFLLAWARADFYNPISQFLVTITNPLLVPLRRVIPSFGSVDTATLVLAYGLKLIELSLIVWTAGLDANVFTLAYLAVLELAKLVIYIYLVAVIVQAILSWISPGTQYYNNPIASLLQSLTAPLLRPVQRVMPPLGGIDLSPLLVIIALNIALILLRSFYR
ncbi:MAG: YggT family protein [Pseudomonadota bacterium]|nr:YggT family protein [Pseudomonadota bacterium]